MSSNQIFLLQNKKENLIRLLKLIQNNDKNLNIRSSLRFYYFNKLEFHVSFVNMYFRLKKKNFFFLLNFFFLYRIVIFVNVDNYVDVLSFLKLKYRSYPLVFFLKKNKIIVLGNAFMLLPEILKSLHELNSILIRKKIIIPSIKKNFQLKTESICFEMKMFNKFVNINYLLNFFKSIQIFNNFYLFYCVLLSKLIFMLCMFSLYQVINFIHFQLYYGYFATINKKL